MGESRQPIKTRLVRANSMKQSMSLSDCRILKKEAPVKRVAYSGNGSPCFRAYYLYLSYFWMFLSTIVK